MFADHNPLNLLSFFFDHAIDFSYILVATGAILGYRQLRFSASNLAAVYLPVTGLVFLYLLTGESLVLLLYSGYAVLCWTMYKIYSRFQSAIPGVANAIIILFALILILYKVVYPNLISNDPMFWVPILGVSYVSFRALDFSIEMGRGRIKTNVSLLDIASYLMFFPTLSQGPIMRFLQFQKELNAPLQKLSRETLIRDIERLCIGIIKILFLGKLFFYCTPFNPDVAESVVNKTGLAILSLYATYLYIYTEFSGISDIAIIFSKWTGFTAPENFDRPLFARNPQEFWARWHMSLTRWCQDHVYFNLQVQIIKMSPGAKAYLVAIVPVLTTFTVIGFWHGLTSHWLYYGMLHAGGVYLVILARSFEFDRWLIELAGTSWNLILTFVGRVLTFNFVSLSLVFALPQKTGAQILALIF
jgi:membrane protein involved in D-alanine export